MRSCHACRRPHALHLHAAAACSPARLLTPLPRLSVCPWRHRRPPPLPPCLSAWAASRPCMLRWTSSTRRWGCSWLQVLAAHSMFHIASSHACEACQAVTAQHQQHVTCKLAWQLAKAPCLTMMPCYDDHWANLISHQSIKPCDASLHAPLAALCT